MLSASVVFGAVKYVMIPVNPVLLGIWVSGF